MKNILKHLMIIALAVCFFDMQAYAQSTTTPVKKTSSGALSPDRSKMLCKVWQLDTVSAFGVGNKANGKEANDGITFGADGSFFITNEGAASSGTWTYSAGRINTHTTNTDVPDNKMSFTIISLVDNRMVLEYQSADLTRTQYTYEPKKQ